MTDPITQSMIQGAAGAAGDATYVDDVFMIDRYHGNGQNDRDIINGLDLAGEGGVTFIKSTNDNSTSWVVCDSVIGGGYTQKSFCDDCHSEDVGAVPPEKVLK